VGSVFILQASLCCRIGAHFFSQGIAGEISIFLGKCFSTSGGQNLSRPPASACDACPMGPPYLPVLILLISSSSLNTSPQPPRRASTSAPGRRRSPFAVTAASYPRQAAAAHPLPSPPPTCAAPLAPPSLFPLSVVPRVARSSSSPMPRAGCKEGMAFRSWGWAWPLPPAREAWE
jgi:hypothetical protein